MNLRFLTLACFVTATTFAADAPKLPAIPTEPIAEKKELIFSDDFERAELGKAWAIVVPTFSLENGTLKGMQSASTPRRRNRAGRDPLRRVRVV
ncbi:MAG: hypothetical protein U1F71_01730 [Verrucomicrobiaceae bacterium]